LEGNDKSNLGQFTLIKILAPGHEHFYGQYVSDYTPGKGKVHV